MNKSGNTLNPCLVCFHVSILSSRCCDRESLTTKSRDKLLPWTSLLCSLFLMICWWSKFKRILVQSPLFYRWENWGWEKPVLEIRSSRSSFLRVWPLNQQHLYPGENLLEMQTLRLHSTYRLRICIWTRFPWDLCADSLNLKALFRLECSTHPPTPFFFLLKVCICGGGHAGYRIFNSKDTEQARSPYMSWRSPKGKQKLCASPRTCFPYTS